MANNFQLFDNFNARHSTYKEIAETFVPNDDFYAIAKNNHSFILGPRGCGKTTLFKMLTAPALHYWHPDNEKDIFLKNNFPFIAIYIPSDELWKDQLRKITNPIQKEEELQYFISNALINLNILSNFCSDVKKYISLFEFDDKMQKEYDFSIKLIKAWKLNDCIASISDIQFNLIVRKNDLLNKLKAYIFNKKTSEKHEVDFEDYYHLDFLDSISNGIIAFEDVYYNGEQKKWALCFDELELISDTFITTLINKLRITPSNIVFKLCSGPLTEFENNIAQIFHDYEVVKMWPFSYKEEQRYMVFCEEIAVKRIEIYLKNNFNIEGELNFDKLFGRLDYKKAVSEFNFKIDENVNEDEANSLLWYSCKELAKKDDSYSSFLIKNKIDPENPIPSSQINYAAIFRKTKEIVINRLIFNQYSNGAYVRQRTRKEFLIYYGKDTILKICEGNPRFIINIINELLKEKDINAKTNIDELWFSPEIQASVIKNVSSRFKAMLNTFPTSSLFKGQEIDLNWLISKIGDYFTREINEGPFKMNPANCFMIKPENTKQVIQRLIKIGVGLGAFIKVDNNIDDILIDNYTRFRISYLLYPEFKLPLRLYNSVKLNNIIKAEDSPLSPKLFE